MERADYSSPAVVKGLLMNYDGLMELALKGDSMAATVCIDIKRAVHTEGVLTFKQRRYLRLWWEGFNTYEIADMYNKNPWGINVTIHRGLGNISKRLQKKLVFDPPKLRITGKGCYQ